MTKQVLASKEEWRRARLELLAEEKAMTKALEKLARKRRELPWVAVEKDYQFTAPEGTESLADLFAGRKQLLTISNTSKDKIEAYRKRMGWQFKWVSSLGSDFNHDMNVTFSAEDQASGEMEYNFARKTFPSSETPGLSAFIRTDEGGIAHTYPCYARGLEIFNSAYQMLDMTALGRHENPQPYPMSWVRRRDQYENKDQ